MDTLPACIDALLAIPPHERPEIIIADGGSTDGTLDYAEAHPCLKTVRCTGGRAPQMNEGAAVAEGHFLWFLHADTVPPSSWVVHLRKAAFTGLPACFSLHFTGQEASLLLRFYARGSRWPFWWVRFGDQSLFVAHDQFRDSGGYREDHLLMEGHEIARRLKRQHGGFTVLPAAVTTSSRRYEQYGKLYTQAVFVVIVVLYYLNVSQPKLVSIYRRAFSPQSRSSSNLL